MAEEKKEPWLNALALSTVILAVCATLATFKGGGHSTRSVLRQSQASDRWAHYQSKSIKGNLYELEKERLERELAGVEGAKARAERLQKDLADAVAKVAKYDKEKKEIEQEARQLEKERNEAQAHSGAFGLAVIFLQIAILLSSIAALLKQKPVWLLGLAVGVVGIAAFANGFMLLW